VGAYKLQKRKLHLKFGRGKDKFTLKNGAKNI
jgi:hypothetical protein